MVSRTDGNVGSGGVAVLKVKKKTSPIAKRTKPKNKNSTVIRTKSSLNPLNICAF